MFGPRFSLSLIDTKLDCVRPRWHHLDGVKNHLSSDGIEWHMDMPVKDLRRAHPVE